jgi:aminoglycoside 3-N-acetyltransferase
VPKRTLQAIISKLSPSKKSVIRGWYHEGKVKFVQHFRSYDGAALKRRLTGIGIGSGDTLLIHSAYGSLLGFQGSPSTLIDAFLEVIGPKGNLLMVSMPFFSSTSEYLKKTEVFDVRKTPSRMGLVSETFRRRPGVLRSLHPTHPVLAYGPDAKWIVAGHEDCEYACGPQSPFEKLLDKDGKILFFGVTEFHFTFHHYLEHMVKDSLPFPLYEQQPYNVKVFDEQGQTRQIRTFVFTQEAIARRRVHVLFDELATRGLMKKARIGNTSVVLIKASDTVACTKDQAKRGIYFYDFT